MAVSLPVGTRFQASRSVSGADVDGRPWTVPATVSTTEACAGIAGFAGVAVPAEASDGGLTHAGSVVTMVTAWASALFPPSGPT
ncbi:hypothetical protein FAIPA1_320041 [Frankia sp. AiPs1]